MRLKLSMTVLAAAGLATALAACGSELDRFDIEESSRATVPEASTVEKVIGDGLGFDNFGDMEITQSQEFQNQDVSANEVDSVTLKSFQLAVVEPPSGQDLTFLNALDFYVEADGLERKLIASGADFPEGQTEVDLELADVELKPYVLEDSVTITTQADGSRPDQETTIEARIVLTVDINVTGALTGG